MFYSMTRIIRLSSLKATMVLLACGLCLAMNSNLEAQTTYGVETFDSEGVGANRNEALSLLQAASDLLVNQLFDYFEALENIPADARIIDVILEPMKFETEEVNGVFITRVTQRSNIIYAVDDDEDDDGDFEGGGVEGEGTQGPSGF